MRMMVLQKFDGKFVLVNPIQVVAVEDVKRDDPLVLPEDNAVVYVSSAMKEMLVSDTLQQVSKEWARAMMNDETERTSLALSALKRL